MPFEDILPPLFDYEVGSGWLVASGWQKLLAAVGACVDWRRVARPAREQPPKGLVEWIPVSTAQAQQDRA
jgi:hypothetical protein